MQKILVSLPDDLAARMKRAIPAKQRSKVISGLLEAEIIKREDALYRCALEVEADQELNKEMEDWEEAIGDGIGPETW